MLTTFRACLFPALLILTVCGVKFITSERSQTSNTYNQDINMPAPMERHAADTEVNLLDKKDAMPRPNVTYDEVPQTSSNRLGLQPETIGREALFKKFNGPEFFGPDAAAYAVESQQEVRDYIASVGPKMRPNTYKLFPPAILTVLKDMILEDYQAMRPRPSSEILDALCKLSDNSIGENLLEDLVKNIQLADSSKNFDLGHVHSLVTAVSRIDDPDQMNRLATYVTNAPNDIREQLVMGIGQSSQNTADFYFLLELQPVMPEAANFATGILQKIDIRRNLLAESLRFNLTLPPGDFPASNSEKMMLMQQLESEEMQMIEELNRRGIKTGTLSLTRSLDGDNISAWKPSNKPPKSSR